jgi:hypothetical protein
MGNIFMPYQKRGIHWENLEKAKTLVERLSLDVSSSDERQFEDRISGALQPNFDEFIDQRNIQQTITRVTLFGHDHRPDMSIGTDGIAIEVKLAKSGSSFREAIGQALIYRIGYRFVLIVWVDITKDKIYKLSLNDKKTREIEFLKEMEEQNIFCIIK